MKNQSHITFRSLQLIALPVPLQDRFRKSCSRCSHSTFFGKLDSHFRIVLGSPFGASFWVPQGLVLAPFGNPFGRSWTNFGTFDFHFRCMFGTPSGTSLWIVLGLHLGAPLRTLWVPLGVFCDTTSSVRSLLSSIPRLESHLDAPCPTLVRFLVCLRVYVIFLGPSRRFRIKQDAAETTQRQNEKGSQSRITKGMFVEQIF